MLNDAPSNAAPPSRTVGFLNLPLPFYLYALLSSHLGPSNSCFSPPMAFLHPFPFPVLAQSFSKPPLTLSRTPTCHQPQPSPSPVHSLTFSLLAAAALTSTITTFPLPSDAYGLFNGRLEKCRGDLPCISTSSVGNPSKFGPPWSFQPETDDPDIAWASLKSAIQQSKDSGKIVDVSDGPEVYYLRAEFPSAFRGVDDVEFRMVKEDALVTYRSASREAIYVYPLQTPINTDKNRTRLLDIRRALGWEEFAGFNVFGIGNDAQ